MARRAIHTYVASVCVVALCALFLLDWTPVFSFTSANLLGFAVLAGVGIFSEALALSLARAGHSSITFLPLLACQLLFGSAATAAFIILVYAVIEFLIRRKELIRATFNLGQLTLAGVIAGWVFNSLGGFPLATSASPTGGLAGDLVPFVGFTAVFLTSNHVAVTLAVVLQRGVSFRRVWRDGAWRAATNGLYDLLVSPVAIGVAFLFLELGVLGILIALLPILFIRHAYLTTYKLQEANRDLLKALIKAIETRDPYTSGHSMRVSHLARRIAEEMGLNRRKTEAIETAALLHDIGKIDAVYSEILEKPGSLTSEERAVIESHVLKGVELLESLSSFGDDVIAAVRHHHERMDGKGYPDGLEGEDIPLGGRIIKVCDAIDAMLSDRPYRKALDLSAVEEQLTIYSGSQFDQGIVERITSTGLLSEYARKFKVEKAVYADSEDGSLRRDKSRRFSSLQS